MRAGEEAQASSCWEVAVCGRGHVGSPRPHPQVQRCLQSCPAGPRASASRLNRKPLDRALHRQVGRGAGQCPS